MIILALGETLEPIDEEQFKAEDRSAVFVATLKEAKEVMELAEMVYEGDINLQTVSFCRQSASAEWRPSRNVLRAPFAFPSFWTCWEAGTRSCFLSISGIS